MKKNSKKAMTWRDVWKPPFKYDGIMYVFANDGQLSAVEAAYGNDIHPISRDLVMKDICRILNGDRRLLHEPYTVCCVDGPDFNANGVPLSVRGYGHLRGSGGRGLTEHEADRLQDELRDFIIAKLTEAYED